MSFHDSIFGPPTPPNGLPPKPPSHWLPPRPPSHWSPPPSGAHETIQGHRSPGFGSGNDCCNQRIGHNYECLGQENDVLNQYNMEIQRDLEKVRIREEIIAGEIAWRRGLEAEVREELRMERELALRLKGGNAFDISHVPLGKSSLQELEKMIAMCVEEKLRVWGGFETSGANSSPLQRINIESNVKEADDPKERIIFVPKQVLSPAKESAKKAIPGVGSAQEKKVWVCKSKEADQKCTDIALGVLAKETSPVPSLPQEPKINLSKPSTLHIVGTEDSGKNGVPNLPIIEEKDTVDLKVEEKKSFIYWCEMCDVRVLHENLKKDHLNGKRHLNMLQKCTNIGLVASPEVATSQPISTTVLVPSPPQEPKINHLPKIKEKDSVGLKIKKKKSFSYWCEMCQVRAEHENLKEAHLKGKRHLRMLQKCTNFGPQGPNLPKIKEKEGEVLKIKVNKNITFYCEMCKVRAVHEKVKEAHLKGKKHFKKLQIITFHCEMCNVRADHEIVKQAHLKGKKHLKKLQKNIPAKSTPPKQAEKMDIMSALQLVLKKSRARGGLARGLHECAKAIGDGAAQLCVLAEECDPDYDKLVKAFCADHNVSVISVPSCITLGEWAGMCDMDGDEGNARNVVACSCVVVKDYGEESEGLNIVQEYVKSHSTNAY